MLQSFKYFRELYIALFIILVIAAGGSIGYMFIEDLSFIEALYMTIITVSTVGFKEVTDLSDAGRYFTIGLIITSFGTFAYAISSVSKYIITGTYAEYYKKYKMHNKIKKLKGHTIICGAGNVGSQASKNLEAHREDVVIIEKNPDKIERLREEKILHIEGDANNDDVLLQAGIERAASLITTLPKDTENVFIVLTARELNEKLKIASRCTNETTSSKLQIAGANWIILPDKVGGARMAGFIINQNISQFLDTIAMTGRNEEYLLEVLSKELPGEFIDGTIADFSKHFNTECKVIGLRNADDGYKVNPGGDSKITEGCELFLLGTTPQIKELKAAIGL
jgi:voltage-gated potassium channel